MLSRVRLGVMAGACYATSGWDEAGKGLGIYKDGDDRGMCLGISVGMNHGIEAWQRKDGTAFVFTEDDYRPKIRFYIVPPQPAPKLPPAIPAPAQL